MSSVQIVLVCATLLVLRGYYVEAASEAARLEQQIQDVADYVNKTGALTICIAGNFLLFRASQKCVPLYSSLSIFTKR